MIILFYPYFQLFTLRKNHALHIGRENNTNHNLENEESSVINADVWEYSLQKKIGVTRVYLSKLSRYPKQLIGFFLLAC